MSLLDRLKPTPRWKHADAQVRLAAVHEFDVSREDALAVLASLARGDADARVRKAAVGRIGNPAVLADAARDDADEQVRQAACEALVEMATGGGDRAAAALAGLRDPRQLGMVAKSAALEPVRRAAVERIDDPRVLGSVARNASDVAVAVRAIERLDDRTELLNVALRSDQKDAAIAAFERAAGGRPDDVELLRNAAAKAVNKGVQRRARALLQQWEEAEAARQAADLALRQREVELCQRAEALGETGNWQDAAHELQHAEEAWRSLSSTHDDLAARFAAASAAARAGIAKREQEAMERARLEEAQQQALGVRRNLVERIEALQPSGGMKEQLDLARAEWEGLPPVEGFEAEAFALQRRFDDACLNCETALRRRAEARAALEQLDALATRLEAAAAEQDLPAARERWAPLEREWREQSAAIAERRGVGVDDAPLQDRYRQASAHIEQRLADKRASDEKAQRDTLRRLERLAERLDKRATADDLSLKEADRGLKELREAIDEPGTLPTREDRDRVLERLRAAHAALIPRARDLREADDWRRFANATVQEELCGRVEALQQKINTAEQPDLEAASKELREINNRWRDVAEAPRGQAQALWHRYRRAFDQVRARTQEYFTQQAAQRGENQQRKEALVRRAEELMDSTDWIRTADELRKLQADWKAIGPVPRDQAKVLWDRFRTACDRFFTRKQEDLNHRKEVWGANLEKKDALVKRAEELAESTDWDHAAAELRRLQAEWRTIGPVRKNKGEALWNRFRGACDRFFERHKQRDQIAATERLHARETVLGQIEALVLLAPPPDDIVQQLRTLRQRWEHTGHVPHDQAEALQQRYEAAIAQILSSHAETFRGTDLDPDANTQRMEKLIARVEKLAAEQAPAAMSSSEALAAMLREALASNQIGGRSSEDARWRAAAEDVKQAQAAWKRIGPAPPDKSRELTERFRRACDRVFERHRRKLAGTRG
ncbi:MAG: DUF349 domain-containing protein [Acidobacteria bacterium]|nr:DUF349 domain-containing protein [Acidobacteriota bacterium]